jgi:hypothetical protein
MAEPLKLRYSAVDDGSAQLISYFRIKLARASQQRITEARTATSGKKNKLLFTSAPAFV